MRNLTISMEKDWRQIFQVDELNDCHLKAETFGDCTAEARTTVQPSRNMFSH
jgi:hypothetical protein